jgi:hypothetical protein
LLFLVTNFQMRFAELLPGVTQRATLRRYLLGGLSVRERARLEERYFENDGLFEKLEMVEDELVDAYVRRHLSESDSRLFEENYLSSERRRQKLRIARELLEYAGEVELPAMSAPIATRFRFWQLAFLAGFVLFAGIVGWRLTTVHHNTGSSTPGRIRPAAPSELHVPPAQPPAIALVLRSSQRGTTTGAGSNLLTIPPGDQPIRLEVYPQDLSSTRFRAELFQRGRSVWRQDVIPAAGQELILNLHSADLPTGTYFLSVIGLDDEAKPLTRERFGLEVVHRGQAAE